MPERIEPPATLDGLAIRQPPVDWDGLCRCEWFSHGCDLRHGHEGPCVCECAYSEDEQLEPYDLGHEFNAGRAPFYGPDTEFRGRDAEHGRRRLAEWLEAEQ